jgi:hypothetical protein
MSAATKPSRIAAAALALCALATAHSARAESDPALLAIERARLSHPDDADLDWARIRRYAELARTAQAAQALAEHEAKWPGHRPDSAALRGRWHYELGGHREAIAVLEAGLAAAARSGADPAPLHFYLGLSLRKLGRARDALPHFESAAQSPELRAEARLLAALAKLDLGDRDGARRDFEWLVAEAPDSDAARSAELLLAATPRPLAWLALEARAALAYDSNVTLESVDLPGIGDRDDGIGSYGASISVTPPLGARLSFALGAHYDESRHFDLTSYDTRRVAGAASAGVALHPRLRFDAPALLSWYELDDDPYLLQLQTRPGLLFSISPEAGAIQLYAEYALANYQEDPLFPALERDGHTYGAGLRYGVGLPSLAAWLSEAWLSPRLYYSREDDRERDGPFAAQVGNAYDHNRYGGELRLGVGLPLALAIELQVAVEGQRYDNPNLIDFLIGGNPNPRERRDTIVEAGGKVRRPLGRYVELELFGTHRMNDSNIGAFDYDRTLVGLGLRVRTPR